MSCIGARASTSWASTVAFRLLASVAPSTAASVWYAFTSERHPPFMRLAAPLALLCQCTDTVPGCCPVSWSS